MDEFPTHADDSLGYDELPYPSGPYPFSHCDHLAMVARLFGISTADVGRCRVLEVGCADGANLIPMALGLAESRFVGIDLSARQIAAGQATIARLGLANIELRRRDLTEFGGETFDYIIAHGVFSWTSREVQSRLLDVCRACLAPAGVAFISYNVYPGWQQQKAVREWLLRSTAGSMETGSRLAACRQLMGRLRSLLATGDDSFSALVNTLARLEGWNDGYLRHDLLEDSNEPQFFCEFADRLSAHRLKFFAEADVASMAGTDLPSGLAAPAARLSKSLLAREQLYDLLANRAFRQSLVCRDDCAASERIDSAAIEKAYVVSTLRREALSGHKSLNKDSRPLSFRARSDFVVDVDSPSVAAALDRLAAAWPAGAWFDELIADDGSATTKEQRQSLGNVLLAGFVERAVELHSVAPAAATQISERPEASPLARLQAESGPLVTSLRHDVVRLGDAARRLIGRLDGTNDRPALEQWAKREGIGEAAGVGEVLAFLLRAGLLRS